VYSRRGPESDDFGRKIVHVAPPATAAKAAAPITIRFHGRLLGLLPPVGKGEASETV
jgi:hypothetical protein